METCQRIEAFTLGPCSCPAPSRLAGTEAVEHLAALAAGLESAAIGEYQVLGQVRAGIAPLRPQAKWLDNVIASARQLRAEAGFSASTGSLLDTGLKLAQQGATGSLLVIGAGAAGREVARRACALGFERVSIASRRHCDENGTCWVPLEDMAASGPYEVVVGCLGAAAGEIGREALPEASLFIDLGSPPNFSADVRPTITLDAIVHVARTNEADVARRNTLRRRLSALLQSRLDAAAEGLSPVARLRKNTEAIRAREAARIARLHPGLPPQTIDSITRSLMNQLLHAPSERLRHLEDPELAARLADLFVPGEPAR